MNVTGDLYVALFKRPKQACAMQDYCILRMSIDEKEEPERFKIIGKGFIDHPRGARLRRPGGQTDGKLHFDALEAINAAINTHCKFLSIHKYLDSPAATQFNKHPFRGSRASGFLHLFPAPITRQDGEAAEKDIEPQ